MKTTDVMAGGMAPQPEQPGPPHDQTPVRAAAGRAGDELPHNPRHGATLANRSLAAGVLRA
jgi:hypothetical protein